MFLLIICIFTKHIDENHRDQNIENCHISLLIIYSHNYDVYYFIMDILWIYAILCGNVVFSEIK